MSRYHLKLWHFSLWRRASRSDTSPKSTPGFCEAGSEAGRVLRCAEPAPARPLPGGVGKPQDLQGPHHRTVPRSGLPGPEPRLGAFRPPRLLEGPGQRGRWERPGISGLFAAGPAGEQPARTDSHRRCVWARRVTPCTRPRKDLPSASSREVTSNIPSIVYGGQARSSVLQGDLRGSPRGISLTSAGAGDQGRARGGQPRAREPQ